MTQIAVIGAGLAGLAAARRMHEAGLQVVLFDKSRGVGGRLATRRIDTMAFDHGAQFFTARGETFSRLVAGWAARGVVTAWPAAEAQGGAPRYVGTPGMSAPARALAAGLVIVTGRTVARLARSRVDGRWSVHDADGVVSTAGIDRFDAVVLAIPAPQAGALLAASDAALPGLEAASYAPCWALLVAATGPVPSLPDASGEDDGVLSWVARNGSKPGRAALPETFTAHAGAAWSRENLERPTEDVRDRLLAALAKRAGPGLEPIYAVVHRWRYALVETPAGRDFLWDAALGLGACGDWCLGGRVEAAFDSGHAMGGHLAATFAGRPEPVA